MKIFNQKVIFVNKITLILFLLSALICFYLCYYFYLSDIQTKAELHSDPNDIPLVKPDQTLIQITPSSETISPRSSDPVGSYSITDKKVQ